MVDALRTARLFARLRLKFLRNSFRGGAKTVVPAVLSLVGSALLAVIGVTGSISVRREPTGRAMVITVVAATVAAVAALVGPVLFAGVDDSLSAERLATYPLTRRRRLVGLFAAALVSPVAIVAFAVASAFGLALGTASPQRRSVAGVLVAIVAAMVLWLLLVVVSRVLATAIARMAASRRGKDLTIALGMLVGFSGWLWSQVARMLEQVSFARYQRFADVARWTPPGALGRSIVQAGQGRVGAAFGGLALGAAGLAVSVGLWWLALARADIDPGRASSTPAAARPRTRRARGGAAGDGVALPAADVLPAGIFAGVLGRLPHTVSGAVAVRDLRYLWRHPRQRVGTATLVLVAVVLPLVNVRNAAHRPEITLLGTSAALMGTLGSLNQIGIEGRALWIHLLSGITPRAYLRGKNLALVTYLLPLVVLSTSILAAVSHGWRYLPAGVLAGAGALLAGIGVGNVCSVLVPVPQSEGSNPFANGTGGQGCASGVLILLWTLVALVVVSPVAIALLLLRAHPVACTLAGVAGLGYGTGAWWLGSRVAEARLAGREPELQQAVTPAG